MAGSMDPLHWASIFEKRGYSTEPHSVDFEAGHDTIQSQRSFFDATG